ncbi:hypothetical protein E4U41_005327 [Claviceps citrina]|nr:hypothetical protein E4U41_005327 [Claviceps citrina]
MSCRAEQLNEARIFRDVTPYVVPSPEHLFMRGETGLQWYGEELNTDWTGCARMGWTRPKPDVTIGLRRDAFSKEELKKLQDYSTPTTPTSVTQNTYFPFLVCEVKSAQRPLGEADAQNLHSAAIAVNAIFKLYEAAYGWRSTEMLKDLHGQALVFSVSHTASLAGLYAHFALCHSQPAPQKITFHRETVKMMNFRTNGVFPELLPYNFVRNVYDFFAPQHLARIRAAISSLKPQSTNLIPATTSDLGEDASMDEDSAASDYGRGRTRARQNASVISVTTQNQLTLLCEQLTEQNKQLAEQRAESAKQLAEQRAESAKQLAEQKAENAKLLGEQKAENAKLLGEQRAERAKQLAEQKAETTKLLGEQRAESAKQLAEQKAETTKLLGEQKTESAKLLDEQKAEIAKLRGEQKAASAKLLGVRKA